MSFLRFLRVFRVFRASRCLTRLSSPPIRIPAVHPHAPAFTENAQTRLRRQKLHHRLTDAHHWLNWEALALLNARVDQRVERALVNAEDAPGRGSDEEERVISVVVDGLKNLPVDLVPEDFGIYRELTPGLRQTADQTAELCLNHDRI